VVAFNTIGDDAVTANVPVPVGNVNVGVAAFAGAVIVYLPDAVEEANAIDPVLVPGMPRTGAMVYDGVAEEVVLLPSIVPPPAFASAAVSVPEVVTAPEGVDDNTVPSPVNVTLVTVPEPTATVVNAPVVEL
jgi:hypothetical protein